MLSFQFYVPTKVIFGEGKRKDVGDEAYKLGNKVLFVVGPHIKEAGLADDVIESLISSKIEPSIFTQGKPDPSSDIVEKAVEEARKNKCDVIIGMGGGSSMDLAKITAALVRYKGTVWDYKAGKDITHVNLPLILIPTTAGTGSEVNQYAVITDEKTKTKGGIGNLTMFPEVAVVDPELTYKVPPRLTAVSGVDALIHAIENYISKAASPVSDFFAMDSIKLNAQNLLLAFSNGSNKTARLNMVLSSMYAGISNACTGCAAAHVMGNPLSQYFQIEHGIGVGLMMPQVMRFMLEARLERLAGMAELMGEDRDMPLREKAEKAIELVKKHLEKVDFPKSLKEFGVKEKDLRMMAEEIAGHPAMVNNPKQMNIEDCEQVYRWTWEG